MHTEQVSSCEERPTEGRAEASWLPPRPAVVHRHIDGRPGSLRDDLRPPEKAVRRLRSVEAITPEHDVVPHCVASMAFELGSVLSCRIETGAIDAGDTSGSVAPPYRRLFHAWWGLLDSLLRRGPGLSVQLRVSKGPGPGRPVQVAMVLHAAAPTPDAATACLDDVWYSLRSTILTLAPLVEWVPVTKADGLEAILGSVPTTYVGELMKREETHPRAAVRVYPFRLRADDMGRIASALAAVSEPALYAATLTPVALSDPERTAIRAGALGPWNGEAPERLFDVRVHLASAAPLSDDLIHAVGTTVAGYEGRMILAEVGPADPPDAPRGGYFYFAPATDEGRRCAVTNLQFGQSVPWEPSMVLPSLSRLRRLADPLEASMAFRLPISDLEARAASPALPAAPLDFETDAGAQLGCVRYCGVSREVLQSDRDAALHTYAVGRTGSGKSTLLLNLSLERIAAGYGVCVVDPHGDLADELLSHIPAEHADRVSVFDPTDVDFPVGLNLVETDPRFPEQKTFVINELIAIMEQLYDMRLVSGPIFEQYFRYGFLCLMGDPKLEPDITMLERFLSDRDYRRGVLDRTTYTLGRDFFRRVAEKMSGEGSIENMTAYVSSKLSSFLANDFMLPIVAQPRSGFNLRSIMDEGRVLVVRLNKGRLGKVNTRLVGMVLVMRVLLAAMSRSDVPVSERRPFHLLVDEFQTLVTPSMAELLAEARKYGLRLTLANQNLDQVSPEIRAGLLGNVGTLVAFRVGPADAPLLAQAMGDVSLAPGLVALPSFQALLRPTIRGKTYRPFVVHTPPPPPAPSPEVRRRIVEASRRRHARPRAEVLAAIDARQ